MTSTSAVLDRAVTRGGDTNWRRPFGIIEALGHSTRVALESIGRSMGVMCEAIAVFTGVVLALLASYLFTFLANGDSVLSKINSGQGSLGLLVNDPL